MGTPLGYAECVAGEALGLTETELKDADHCALLLYIGGTSEILNASKH